jgi:Protein of unknown function (DUF3341)
MNPDAHPTPEATATYGVLAEFATAEELAHAARAVSAAGYRRVEAYSPHPVEGVADALGFKSTRLPFIVLIGGLIGGLSGYGLQWWTMVYDYPLNIGGRPVHSWPAFIPVTFELTILGASLAAVLGMFALNGLPQPYHPLFNVPDFSLASQNRFFLCIEASDPKFDVASSTEIFRELDATKITVVET